MRLLLTMALLCIGLCSWGQVDFSVVKSGICTPVFTTFTDNTSGTIISRVWDFGAGEGSATTTLATAGHNYITASPTGTFTVTLTVEFSDHTKQSATKTVEVRPAPVASFTASTYAGCKSLAVNFMDNSIPGDGVITAWLWDLGDGTPTTSQNPSTTYTTNGVNHVSLIVYNSFGCKSEAVTKDINVYDNAVASFSVDKTTDCTAPSNFTFTNTSTGQGVKNYTWNFGDLSTPDNTTSPIHPYTTAGQYNVSLKVVNGTNCSNTSPTKTIYVGTPQISNMNVPDAACTGTSVYFSASVLPASFTGCTYQWVFSDGSTASSASFYKSFSTPGTYTVTLTITNGGGCVSDPITKTITIKQTPVANFNIDNTVLCKQPYTANFTNTGSTGGSYSYFWNFGDGVTSTTESPGHTYDAATGTGSRYVTLTVTDNITGCSNTKTFSYLRIGPPQVTLQNVTPNSGCGTLPVTATASVSTADVGTVTYLWNFDDGIVTTTTNTASFTYTTAGTKNVFVSITTASGCTATSNTLPVTVIQPCPPPDPGGGGGGGGGGGFTFSGGACSTPFTFTFTDTASQNQATTVVTSWDFGDGSPVVNTTPVPITITHTFPNAPSTIYTVTVTRKNTVTGVVTSYSIDIPVVNEKAAFSVSQASACTQQSITFSTSGLNNLYIKSVTWDFGDNNTKTLNNSNPPAATFNTGTTHMYGFTGSYTPMLTITDKNGCISAKSLDLPIEIGGPTASFTATDLLSCKAQNFTKPFTDASTPLDPITAPIVQWDWYVWATGSSVPSTPTKSFNVNTVTDPVQLPFTNTNNAYTQYSVKLIVKDINGCSSAPYTQSAIVKSYWPKAVINTSPIVTCNNYTFGFSNGSVTPNPTYQWDFGDGSPISTQTSPSHTYPTQDGAYNVTLIATETALPKCADTTTKLNLIQLIKPTANFTTSSLAECAPIAVTFTNTSLYANSSSWAFGDGGAGSTLTNPSGHIYRVGGDYHIILTVTGPNGCTNTIDSVIHIKGPNGNFSYGELVGCNPFTFTAKVSGTNVNTFAWDFRDGTLDITPSTTTTLTHTYTQAGIYQPNVILSSTDGCTYTVQMKPGDKVIVDEIHSAFSIDKSVFCKEGLVSFTNNSTVASFSSITDYLWTFGDGATDVTANPGTHLYATAGTYNATLAVKSKYGCTDTTTKTVVTIHPVPTPAITGDDIICLAAQGPLLQYSNTGTSDDAISSYEWKIDDNTVGSEASLSLDFRIPGNHVISLMVTTINGCDSTVTKNIIIDSIRADFTIDKNHFCGNGDPAFTNLSSVAATSSITTYQWNFGDNTNSMQADPGTHYYGVPGTYAVTLYAKTENGCEATSEPQKIIVYNNPIAGIDGKAINCLQSTLSSALNYTYNGTSVDPITTYLWKIDNIDVSTEQNLSLDFRTSGAHDIQLIVTTNNNCADTITKQIIIDSVAVDFSIDKTIFCGRGNPEFTNNSTSASPFTEYSWLFGDNTGSLLNQPGTHTYNTPDNYDVTLYIKNENGCEATSEPQKIVVHNNPVAGITGSDIICLQPGNTALDYKASINSVDPVTNYLWKIDNATVTSSQDLYNDFRISGTHNIQLIAITNNNCADTVTKKIIIDSVYVDFSVLDSIKCGDNRIFDFINNSSSAYAVAEYLWQFGDGETGNTGSAQHSYVATGDYAVTLQVKTENNCVDQVTKQQAALIYNKPVISLISDTEKCLKDLVNYSQTVVSEDAIVQQGLYIYDASNLVQNFPLPTGSYTLAYVVETQHGCKDSAMQSLVIHPLPALLLNNDTTICKNSTIILSASGATTYLWTTDGNTFIQNANTASPIITPATDARYLIHAVNDYGCVKDSGVLVKVAEPANLSVSPPVTICAGDRTRLWVKGNTNQFLWSNASSLSNAQSPTPVASPLVTTSYVVKGFSNNVCPDETDSVLVTVVQMPTVDLGPDITTPAGTAITLQPTITGNISSYNWYPATGLSCSDCAKPNFTANANTAYTLTVSTKEGCKAADNINIYVLCNKSSVFIPDAFTPNGDGKNDVFYIMGYGIQSIKNFSVFDRWGKMVFHKQNCNANDRNAGWNGLVDGRHVSQSTTFVYTAEVICAEGKSVFFKGTVVLIR
ncbi:MAG: PKD domain-containing protein [Filimonas sp.]|nr:PKD domain-containing protein [Filimonas sp.]